MRRQQFISHGVCYVLSGRSRISIVYAMRALVLYQQGSGWISWPSTSCSLPNVTWSAH
jgi:hypothetical protein